MRTRKLLFIMILPALAITAAAQVEPYVKYEQSPAPLDQPEAIFLGWNELSVFGGPQIAADDWVCYGPEPVSDVHWWGSFLNWRHSDTPPRMPSGFQFAIWTDVPAGVDAPYSHPGQVLWTHTCYNYAFEFAGWDLDPHTDTYEACFLFHCDIPQAEWFYQPGDNQILWISIAAIYGPTNCACNGDLNGDGAVNAADFAIFAACLGQPPVGQCAQADFNCDGVIDPADDVIFNCLLNTNNDPTCCLTPFNEIEYPFGVKTRQRDFASPAPDAAVRILAPTVPQVGMPWMAGDPLLWPTVDAEADLALYLTSKAGGGSGLKWDQPPLTDPSSPFPDCYYGWDELTLFEGPQIVADDWVCSTDEPVTDFHWWGSYIGWDQPIPPPERPFGFQLAIWTDVPAGVDLPFSHPGVVLMEWFVPIEETNERAVGCDFVPEMMPFPDTCFKYDFFLPEPWQQPAGENILWLSIAPVYDLPFVEFPWGWKTRVRDPQSPAPDAAVRIIAPTAPFPGMIFEIGDPIFYPPPLDLEADMAFQVTSPAGPGEEFIKWEQPPIPVGPGGPFFNGWDEMSRYFNAPVIADDWVCQNEDPITDIHWWGSFIEWDGMQPPAQLPDAFHFGIWTDVPAGADEPFSHPGQLVWEYTTSDYTLDWVGWDIYPTIPGVPTPLVPDSMFYFTVLLPEEHWFFQPPGENIYWLSISAVYDNLSGLHPFGWKTRPHEAGTFPPDAAVRIADPLAPALTPGHDVYLAGNPIAWPTPDYEWADMAFQLTAQPYEPPDPFEPKWTQPPYDPPEFGFDLDSGLWLPEPGNTPKWAQLPSANWPGLHDVAPTQVADNWVCQGGAILGVAWYGNYEIDALGMERRGDGVGSFNITIYADAGVPGPVIFSQNVPAAVVGETATGLVNLEGSAIYRYEYVLPAPLLQNAGQMYWLSVQAVAAGPNLPSWRWQENGRYEPPPFPGPAHELIGGIWQPIFWPNIPAFTEFAFEIISDFLDTQLNVVVADDFISDGRDIEQVRWWGSYLSEAHEPPNDDIHNIDGWLIGFHWADVNATPNLPPDLLAGDPPPTALAIYFAPREAVLEEPTFLFDCNGHQMYRYFVDLEQCCLVCAMPDPRNAYPPPAHPKSFQEIKDWRYWISIQAVVGATWQQPLCELIYTGTLPPFDGFQPVPFWGWHNGVEPPIGAFPLAPAARGQIVDLTPYPPACWEYGNWFEAFWNCPTIPAEPVQMAFDLRAYQCPIDFNNDGEIESGDLNVLLSNWGRSYGHPLFDPRVDLNQDGTINSSDLNILLSAWGDLCP